MTAAPPEVLWGLPIAALIIAIVQVIKGIFPTLDTKYAPLVAIAVGWCAKSS